MLDRIVTSLTVKGMFKKDVVMKCISTVIGFLQKFLWHPSLCRFCLLAYVNVEISTN